MSCKDNEKDINILLLGDEGLGKSIFINSFANYMQYDTLRMALNNKIVCLIPTKFTILDENYVEKYVEIGCDTNENQEIASSSMQGTKSYVFPMGGEDRKIRLIDTPIIGDSRGIDQDNLNFENVLDYLSQYEYLHAICFLLKPHGSINTAYLKFCMVHLLSRLEKSAAQNIIFVFTNTRSTLYRPGETLTVLRKILKEVGSVLPHISIPCSVKNIFCMDNEAFRFLVALKHEFEFTEEELENFSASWEISVRTCKKMLDYITGDDPTTSIKPHVIRNTLSVKEARWIITDLSKPLVNISDMIQDNLTVLERHEAVHMHIWYETKTVGGREENEAIKNKITCTQEQIEAASKLIATLKKKKEEYELESDVISKTLAKFAHFIREHSITIFNDAYEDYLDYLIARKTNLAEYANSDFIKRQQDLKKQYQQEKQLLELVLNQPKSSSQITTGDIYKSIKQLYGLKHTGVKIKELHQLQEKLRSKTI